MADLMHNTVVQEAATRDVHLWSLVLNLVASITHNSSPAAWAAEAGELADAKVATLKSRYMISDGTVFEIEQNITVNYSIRQVST